MCVCSTRLSKSGVRINLKKFLQISLDSSNESFSVQKNIILTFCRRNSGMCEVKDFTFNTWQDFEQNKQLIQYLVKGDDVSGEFACSVVRIVLKLKRSIKIISSDLAKYLYYNFDPIFGI